MATLETFLVLSFFLLQVATGSKTCKPLSCPGNGFLFVRFPFRVKESQPERCGYPGFDLSCSNRSQLIISMPLGGDFTVNAIDYWRETIQVNDPQDCMPGRLLNFAVDSPFLLDFKYARSFTYLNCTAKNTMYTFLTRFPCLSGHNYTVAAMLNDDYNRLPMKLPCRVIKIVQVPLQVWEGSGSGLYADVSLTWAKPDCGACESSGGSCGFKSRSSLEIMCFHTRKAVVLSKRARYGVLIGVGVLGLVLIVALAIRNCKANESDGRHQTNTGFSTFVARQPEPAVVTMGLTESEIELYPKLSLGESDRLPPNSDDNNACSICLSQYRLKEEVRLIPNCKHYFHVHCIDEWLKRNVTCPLCRTPPTSEEQPSNPSSLVTLSLLPSSTRC